MDGLLYYIRLNPRAAKKAARMGGFFMLCIVGIRLFLKPKSSFLGLGLCKNLNALDDEDDS